MFPAPVRICSCLGSVRTALEEQRQLQAVAPSFRGVAVPAAAPPGPVLQMELELQHGFLGNSGLIELEKMGIT